MLMKLYIVFVIIKVSNGMVLRSDDTSKLAEKIVDEAGLDTFLLFRKFSIKIQNF